MANKYSVMVLSAFALTAHSQNKEARPNVIYILMDDLGYGDLGCYGQQKIETPNIDRLREAGMRFTQHYSGSPVSAPSRCVLMTGLHSGHAQIRANDEMGSRGPVANHDSMFVHPNLEGQYPLRAGTMTIARMMQQAGYRTGCFGKWGLGYPGSDGVPNKQGFDRFYGYNCQRQAHNYYPAFLWSDDKREYLENRVIDPHRWQLPEGSDPYSEEPYLPLTQKQYANDLIFDKLIDFVRHRQAGQPLFVMWTTPLPHVSLMAPRRWVNYYLAKFGPEEPKKGGGYLPCRYPHATYAAMVSYFDEQVGKLVEVLKEEGLYDNTLIMFTSDNGPTFNGGSDSPWFNSGGLFRSEYGWGKCFTHEGGIRVPAIVAWPGHVAAGSKTDHISCFQDVMPTLAELIEAKCGETDGISFLPTLLGAPDRQKEHEYLYWEHPEKNIGSMAVRKGKWKAIVQDIMSGNREILLFDLENDLREEHDVAAEHPEIVEEMRAIMQREHTEPENPRFHF